MIQIWTKICHKNNIIKFSNLDIFNLVLELKYSNESMIKTINVL